jgi:hypothetical protein
MAMIRTHCERSVYERSVLQFYEAHQATSNVVVFIMSVRQYQRGTPPTWPRLGPRHARCLRAPDPWQKLCGGGCVRGDGGLSPRAHLPETFSLSVTRRPRLRSLESWLDVPPQAAIPHSTDKNIVTAIVNGADVRSTLS